MRLLGKIPNALTPIYSPLITKQLIREGSSPGVSVAARSSYWLLRNAGVEDIVYRKKGDNFHGLWFVCACVLMYLSNRLRIKQMWGWTAGKLNLTPLGSVPWEASFHCFGENFVSSGFDFTWQFLSIQVERISYAWYNLVLHSHISTADVYWDVLLTAAPMCACSISGCTSN